MSANNDTVLLCRFCGYISAGERDDGRCGGCGAFSGLEAVAAGEARQRSRRTRLGFLRSRIFRAAVFVLPLLGLAVWILWAYTGLPPDPPMPSRRIGDTSVMPAPGDWPQAGRDAANSSSATVPIAETGAPPEPVWQYVAGAAIGAAPAVVGDRVYLTAEDGSVVALDRSTGAILWRYDSGLTAAVTPAVADGLVFAVFRPGAVTALAADTGAVVWSRRLRTASLPSPTVADGRLFVAETDQNRLLALDAVTGATLWDYRLGDWVIAPPAVIDDLLIATANDAKVHILDANTGRRRMIYDAGSARWVRGGPAVADGLLHFSSYGGRVWGIDYRGRRYPLERQILYVRTLLWVWGYTKQGPVQQGSVWSSQTDGEQPYTPALAGETAVVADAGGIVTALDTASGSILWATDVGADITAPPTTAGEVALAGTEHGRIIALSTADGQPQWSATLEGMVTAPPIAAGGVILAATTAGGGTLTALAVGAE